MKSSVIDPETKTMTTPRRLWEEPEVIHKLITTTDLSVYIHNMFKYNNPPQFKPSVIYWRNGFNE